jgi:hypothetical protein
LANIQINKFTIIGILERTRDVDVGVRKLLYKKLQIDLADIFCAPAENLLETLSSGINDRYLIYHQGILVFEMNVSNYATPGSLMKIN